MDTLLNEFRQRPTAGRVLVHHRAPAQTVTGSDERPRVLHLVTSFEAGGTERQFIELLKRLNRNKYDVRLAVIHNKGCFHEEVTPLFPIIPEFPLTSFYNLNALKQLRRLQALIHHERIDVIHAHGFYDSFFGSVAGRLCGVKVIASQRHIKLSDRRVHDWGTRVIHLLAHRVIVNSQGVYDSIIERSKVFADKMIVIRNGLIEPPDASSSNEQAAALAELLNMNIEDRKRLARQRICSILGLSPQVKLLGMVARLVGFKGHRFFVAAAAQVAREIEDAHFVLVGEGTERPAIERQVAQLGLQERVHLLGNRTDSRFLVSAFDVATLPSLSEGLPNSVMEAMSAGVPVVASAIPGTVELIRDGETGYLVPAADVQSLAERLLFVLRHEAESKVVAEKGRELIDTQFGIRRTVEAVEQLYQEVLATPATNGAAS